MVRMSPTVKGSIISPEMAWALFGFTINCGGAGQ